MKKKSLIFTSLLLILLVSVLVQATPPPPPNVPENNPEGTIWEDFNDEGDEENQEDEIEDTDEPQNNPIAPSRPSSSKPITQQTNSEENQENTSEHETDKQNNADADNKKNDEQENDETLNTQNNNQLLDLNQQTLEETRNESPSNIQQKSFIKENQSIFLGVLILMITILITLVVSYNKIKHTKTQKPALINKTITNRPDAELKAIEYIKKMKEHKYTDDMIKQNLLKVGWAKEKVNNLFLEINSQSQ
ncbi:MAG: hypothetical protein ACLFN8_00600 [Candidatus Woesearchaeota archaeon]